MKKRKRKSSWVTLDIIATISSTKTTWKRSVCCKRLNEKKEGEDDEAYHMRKLEEMKKKKKNDNSMPAFIVQENVAENEFGGVEIWSTDS